mmetsp:Transcript_42204/g.83496  ORF Transcript_42204/g.83496 Transcript_42204/m.83496 type:complete len:286 (-) Transcript_42204:1241-2098(-)
MTSARSLLRCKVALLACVRVSFAFIVTFLSSVLSWARSASISAIFAFSFATSWVVSSFDFVVLSVSLLHQPACVASASFCAVKRWIMSRMRPLTFWKGSASIRIRERLLSLLRIVRRARPDGLLCCESCSCTCRKLSGGASCCVKLPSHFSGRYFCICGLFMMRLASLTANSSSERCFVRMLKLVCLSRKAASTFTSDSFVTLSRFCADNNFTLSLPEVSSDSEISPLMVVMDFLNVVIWSWIPDSNSFHALTFFASLSRCDLRFALAFASTESNAEVRAPVCEA